MIRWPLRPLTALLAGLALTLVCHAPQADADKSNTTTVSVKTGFAGYWNRANAAHPKDHHTVTCEPAKSGSYTTIPACAPGTSKGGDWSLDYHAAAGTSVKYSASASGGTLKSKVWAIVPTCRDGGSVGGWTVFVDVYVGGSYEGWVSYSHLDQVAVKAGNTIGSGTTLGKLRKWKYSTCYQVKYDTGVHAHIEMYDAYKFACYNNYKAAQELSFSTVLGMIGSTKYTSKGSRC